VCCEEVLEEVGYRVSPQQLACCASSVISSAGITGAPQAMFFAQVGEWEGAQPEQLLCMSLAAYVAVSMVCKHASQCNAAAAGGNKKPE
jgi:hypothetical protein